MSSGSYWKCDVCGDIALVESSKLGVPGWHHVQLTDDPYHYSYGGPQRHFCPACWPDVDLKQWLSDDRPA